MSSILWCVSSSGVVGPWFQVTRQVFPPFGIKPEAANSPLCKPIFILIQLALFSLYDRLFWPMDGQVVRISFVIGWFSVWIESCPQKHPPGIRDWCTLNPPWPNVLTPIQVSCVSSSGEVLIILPWLKITRQYLQVFPSRLIQNRLQ